MKMYKKAGCSQCTNGQIYSDGWSHLSVIYYERCPCANIKTKRYKKWLKKDKSHMLCKDVNKKKFYDNNSYIIEGDNSTDRDW